MEMMFESVGKKEFLDSLDRGLEQSDKGQARDAFISLDEISDELEEGYNAMSRVRISRRKVAAEV
jgi:hypothetical protein